MTSHSEAGFCKITSFLDLQLLAYLALLRLVFVLFLLAKKSDLFHSLFQIATHVCGPMWNPARSNKDPERRCKLQRKLPGLELNNNLLAMRRQRKQLLHPCFSLQLRKAKFHILCWEQHLNKQTYNKNARMGLKVSQSNE